MTEPLPIDWCVPSDAGPRLPELHGAVVEIAGLHYRVTSLDYTIVWGENYIAVKGCLSPCAAHVKVISTNKVLGSAKIMTWNVHSVSDGDVLLPLFYRAFNWLK